MAKPQRPKNTRIALVLQGGGALGAYQIGVYEALAEHGLVPDWVAGTSIGAINGAIIAGNPPQTRIEKLEQFWRGLAHRDPWNLVLTDNAQMRRLASLWSAVRTVAMGEPGFFTPRFNPFSDGADKASFYDISPLRETLQEVVDFDYLNRRHVRLSVGAVSVTRGAMIYFDSTRQRLEASHIMASGALPPGFPAVRIKGEPFWDGGVYSNTPLETVLEDSPRRDTLCFTVNLWSPDGPEPRTIPEVLSREKEIRYSARFYNEIERYREKHNLRRAVRALYEALPQERRDDEEFKALAELGCHTTMNIVRLGRTEYDGELGHKDIDFSWASVRERRAHGYSDGLRVMEHAPWLRKPPRHTGVVVHTLPPESDDGAVSEQAPSQGRASSTIQAIKE